MKNTGKPYKGIDMKSPEEFKKEYRKQLIEAIWKQIVVPTLYVIVMWVCLTTAGFLLLNDFWRAAGIVSALVLFHMTRAEFSREFFGSRNAIQEQSKG